MEVGPAETEGTDSCASRAVLVGMEPGLCLRAKAERTVPEVEPGIGRLDPDRRRQDVVMQRQGRVDESGESRGALGVTDQRLDGSHDAVARSRAGGLEDLAERVDFDDVSQRRARPVRLHISDGRRRDPRLGIGALDGPDLTVNRRRGQAAARPSLEAPTPLITE